MIQFSNLSIRVLQRISKLHSTNKYFYFKEQISQMHQIQSQSPYSIKDINSINDKKVFSEESKRISNYLNEFTSLLYDKQSIINPIKIKQEYTPQDCQLIADILENRMIFLHHKIQRLQQELAKDETPIDKQLQYTESYLQSMVLIFDLYNFSLLCCASSNSLLRTFSNIFSDWSQFTSATLNNHKNKNIQINFQLLQSISRIFESSTKSQYQQKSLNELTFDIFQFTSTLFKNTSKQLQNPTELQDLEEDNEVTLGFLDLQIQVLHSIQGLQSSGTSQISSINSAEEFRNQFSKNQYYNFWMDLDNNVEEGQNNDNPQSLNVQDVISEKENNSLSKLKDYLLDEVFDGILLKRTVTDPISLVKILDVFPHLKLSEIPSQNFVEYIEKHITQAAQIIKFMEEATSKRLYTFKLSQKVSLYNGFYKAITSTYISTLNSYLKTGLAYEDSKEKRDINSEQTNLSLVNITDIFKIMEQSNVVDFQFLKLLETLLNQNNSFQKLKHADFLKILRFFGKFPLKMETITKNQINFYLSSNFERMNNQHKIDCSVNLLKLENQPEVPLYMLVQRPLFCTIQNMSQVTEFIIQFNTQQHKTLHEKIQFYFLVKTFFKDQIKISSHFEEQLVDLKEAFIRAGFGKISKFQKQILDDLIYQDGKENPKTPQLKDFQSELFLEDIFSVDYLINQNIVIEVNGPQHYFMVNRIPSNYEQQYQDKIEEIEAFEDDVNFNNYMLLENRNTTIKNNLLQKSYKYQVKQIPFLTYEKYKFLNKHTQFVYETVFSKTLLKDLKKIL